MKSEKPGIHIEQRKGSSEKLNGKLIAYVKIEMSNAEPMNPLNSMVRNGILAVQANYVDQKNIRDFFRHEFGISLEKGIEEVIEQARETGGLEGALDPEAVKERLESMKNADFIPIPAKVAYFNTEAEIYAGDVDVFYLGKFSVIAHAHLCVNSFPIIYQSYFREQEHKAMELEIATLLQVIEDPKSAQNANSVNAISSSGINDKAEPSGVEKNIQNYQGDIQAYLLKDLIPKMIYHLNDFEEYAKAKNYFQDFMGDFGFPEDQKAIITLIESTPNHDALVLRRLELLVAKVEALQKEDYEKLEEIRKNLANL